MTRYTAHDYEAAWQVWDNVERRSVSGSFTEAGALAEAARLNASRPAWAKDVVAWAVFGVNDKLFYVNTNEKDARDWAEYFYTTLTTYRIARVRITEIPEQEASDGE